VISQSFQKSLSIVRWSLPGQFFLAGLVPTYYLQKILLKHLPAKTRGLDRWPSKGMLHEIKNKPRGFCLTASDHFYITVEM